MADQSHVEKLKQGAQKWNAWRKKNSWIEPQLDGAVFQKADLRGVNLRGAYCVGTDFTEASLKWANLEDAKLCSAELEHADLRNAHLDLANLSNANLREADLFRADLEYATLSETVLWGANLAQAKLTHATLAGADLSGANLIEANLTGSDLTGAKLIKANLTKADLTKAKLESAEIMKAVLIDTCVNNTNFSNAFIYGISVWDLRGSPGAQENLEVTDTQAIEESLKVNDIEVAPFFYMLLENAKMKKVIDFSTSKLVLIIGRFLPEQRDLLDQIRIKLRKNKRGYLPVIFDFEKPENIGWMDTVVILAHLARFVIADFTNPRIMLQEVQYICSNANRPLLSLIQEDERVPTTYLDYAAFNRNVLPICCYKDAEDLISNKLRTQISIAERRVDELEQYYLDIKREIKRQIGSKA